MLGSIISAGFASGDRVVVGDWALSPIGPFIDVMWAGADGHRTLFVPDDVAAEFVTGVYAFDVVRVVDFEVERVGTVPRRRPGALHTPRRLSVRAGRHRVRFCARWSVPIPVPRPAAVTRWIEGPIARALLGVQTFGTSPTGVREWYRADRWSPLRSARARIGDQDLGPMASLRPACGFGFSEPPARPSWVDVRPLLEYQPGSRPPG